MPRCRSPLILRALLGFGFGGEWAAGAVLIGETIRPQYRGRAVGSVQSGWAVGWGMAVLAQAALFSLLPVGFASHVYLTSIVGASGAIFGLLLAYAMYFPNRELYLYMLFPVKTKYAVMIFGAIELFLTITGSNGVANSTHLAGLAAGWLFLKSGGSMSPWAEVKYRFLKWKIARARSKFKGGAQADTAIAGFDELPATRFLGYDGTESAARILALASAGDDGAPARAGR